MSHYKQLRWANYELLLSIEKLERAIGHLDKSKASVDAPKSPEQKAELDAMTKTLDVGRCHLQHVAQKLKVLI